jgi:mannose-1-phosphate guanylyltransferase
MARQLARIARAGGVRWSKSFRALFPKLEKISIDYAIMEKISDIHVVAADIGWDDVGSWAVVYDLSKKDGEMNVRPTRSLSLDSRGNMIVAQRSFVVTVGVHDLVVVETDDALLVSARGRSQDVGKAVQALEKAGRRELL